MSLLQITYLFIFIFTHSEMTFTFVVLTPEKLGFDVLLNLLVESSDMRLQLLSYTSGCTSSYFFPPDPSTPRSIPTQGLRTSIYPEDGLFVYSKTVNPVLLSLRDPTIEIFILNPTSTGTMDLYLPYTTEKLKLKKKHWTEKFSELVYGLNSLMT